MSSPVPYSKARRRMINRKVVKFATAKGSRVYAPAPGKFSIVNDNVFVETKGGYRHKLVGVEPRNVKVGQTVQAGAWVGRAKGKWVRYKRYNPSGKVVDAMKAVKRDNAKSSPNWLNRAKRVYAKAGSSGDMSSGGGSESKVILHTTESDDSKGTINAVANYCVNKNICYNLLWNVKTGEFVQMYPANVGARSVSNAQNPYLACNRHGRICIQISIVGRAKDRPLKAGKDLKGRRALMQWLDFHGIPRRNITSESRSRSRFVKSGYTNHRSTPGNDHNDLYMTDADWKWLFRP